jgi:hypothetical protein
VPSGGNESAAAEAASRHHFIVLNMVTAYGISEEKGVE